MGRFKAGNPGKPKGAENKVTKEARELVLQLVSDGLEKAKEKLDAIQDPKEYLDTLAKFISYVVPKQTITDITTDGQPIIWNETKNYPDLSGFTFEELYELKYGKKPEKEDLPESSLKISG